MGELDREKSFIGILEKYKYALAVVLIGVFLLLLPGQESSDQTESTQPIQETEGLEQMLEGVLRKIDGAGEVEVLLTIQAGEETHYQTDTEERTDSESSESQSQSVIISDQERNETGLIRRTDPPRYLGALIVCQGGDRAQVRLAIVEAVACVTGLSADRISVLKMK